MSNADKEIYAKEESFGKIDSGFYDFSVEVEFEDALILAWPEKLIEPMPQDPDSDITLDEIVEGSKEVIRDVSRCLEIMFFDVYAMNVRNEGWEEWRWDHTKVPKLGTGRHSIRNFPILRVENSAWKNRVFPEWNRDWMDQVSHWRLISITNNVDILARSAKGGWRNGD